MKQNHWNLLKVYKNYDLSNLTKGLLQQAIIDSKLSEKPMIHSSITCKSVINSQQLKSKIMTDLPQHFPIGRVLGMQLYELIEQDGEWDVKNLGSDKGHIYVLQKDK